MSGTERWRLMRRVLWSLRGLGLFLLGPIVGVELGAVIFGMPGSLQLVACGMFLLSLGMYAMLARVEWRRLSSTPPSGSAAPRVAA